MPQAPFDDPRPRNGVTCVRFAAKVLLEQVARLSGDLAVEAEGLQARYLTSYLADLGASSIVVEEHYIDRHFMQEVDRYYSSCLLYKKNGCGRLHLFRDLGGERLDEERLENLLMNAAAGDREAVAKELEQAYLGFIVVRPLPSVPIGRTVLRPPAQKPTGCATTRYTVHLLGLEVQLEGLGFQQQDQAVGACATTAIWTALQRLSPTGKRPVGASPERASSTKVAARGPGGFSQVAVRRRESHRARGRRRSLRRNVRPRFSPPLPHQASGCRPHRTGKPQRPGNAGQRAA